MSATQRDLRVKIDQLKLDFPNFSSKFIKSVLLAQNLEVARARLQLAVAKKQEDANKLLSSTLGLEEGSKFESPFARASQTKDRVSGVYTSNQLSSAPELPARTINLIETDLNTSIESNTSEKSDIFISSQSSTASSDFRRSSSFLSSSPQTLERRPPPLPPRDPKTRPNSDVSPFALARPSVPSYTSLIRKEYETTIPELFIQQSSKPRQENRTKRKRGLTLSDEVTRAKDDFFDDIEEIYTSKGSIEPTTKRKKLMIDTDTPSHRLKAISAKNSTRISDSTNEGQVATKRSSRRHEYDLGSNIDTHWSTSTKPIEIPVKGNDGAIESFDVDENDGSATVGNESNLSESPSSSTATSDPLDQSLGGKETLLPFALCSQEPPGRPKAPSTKRHFLEESD